MANPKNSRKQLGLSRRNFAKLLNCTEEELAMAEAGKKDLPPDASTMLEKVETTIAEVNNKPPGSMPAIQVSPKFLDKDIKASEAAKRSKLRQIKNILEETRQLLSFMHAPHLVKDDGLSTTSYAQDIELLQLKQQVAKEISDTYVKIEMLKLDIMGLDARIKKANEMKVSL